MIQKKNRVSPPSAKSGRSGSEGLGGKSAPILPSAGKEVFNVNDGYLLACFDRDVNETVITEVAKQKPYWFVMRDSSLSSDNVADNFEQIFKAYSKDTIRRIL